jgi:signal transduction histidine kinase
MYEDREGTFWIGTLAGLSRMTKRTITAYSTRDGLAGDNVYPIYEDRQGKIWIGSWRGLTVFENGIFTDVGKKYGVDDVLVTSLLEDREGALWIGSWSEGVRRVKDGKVTLFPPDELPGTLVRAIVEDRAGNIWFGTSDNRLVKYREGIFTVYSGKDGLSGNEIFVIYEDRQGQLWIGTDRGLNKFKDGVFTAYRESDGIASNIVRSIHEDAGGTLWIGMYDSGIYRYKEGKFAHIGTNDGLFDNGAFRIIEDGKDNFWISCNLGIYRVQKSELNAFADGQVGKITAVPYNRRDGMLSSECNGGGQPAGILTKGGKIWFPTQKGVAVIDPATIPFNSQPPPVVIESFLIDTNAAAVRSTMNIEPGQSNIEIHYSGLSFINPELVKFRYKLEGLDADWIDAGSRRTAFYSHLPPGDYTFSVTAANRDGVWNEQGAVVGITVLPPFWRTRWFTLLMTVVVLSLTFGAYKARISQLKREQRKQEAFSRRLIELQENERKRIAGELHDSLGQNLVVIKNRAWITLQEPANQAQAMEQMEEIADAADQSLSEVREIAYNLRPFLIDRSGLTSAIQTLVRKSAPPELRITSEVDNIDNLLAPEMEINLYRIIQECLNNMIKHAEATAAKVTVKRSGEGIEITVSDNGKGFDTGSTRFGDSANGSGFGLVGITERAKILGGVPVMDSAPGKGTRIYLRLPAQT